MTALPGRLNIGQRLSVACLPVLPLLAQAGSDPATPREEAEQARPNILLVLADDLGFSDLASYGSEINTPTLSALATQGVSFTNYHTAANCAPARAMLLTGVDNHVAGVPNIPEMLAPEQMRHANYQGVLGSNVVTVASLLENAGYHTYMAGKWHITRHVDPRGPKDNWPLQRGFEKFYGTITGAGSFYDPATLCRGNTFITPVNDPEYQPKTYYYTDAISDNAVTFLQQHAEESPDQPFFLYAAYTTAHWPMHALPRDIEKYRGQYDQGFEPIRKARLENLKTLGLVTAETKLSPLADDWNAVKDKPWEARNMEVYAAMIDSMDQGIGRIVAELGRQGELDNTLILFLQDNGGCAEGYGRGTPKDGYATDLKPMGPDDLQTKIWPPMQTRDGRPLKTGPGVMAGPEDTFIGYGRGWANVSNTPFREYKHFAHEGGISTPLIAHWPSGIAPSVEGSLEHQPGHVIDIMATCVDLAGGVYPEKFGEHDIIPVEGVSLRPAFSGKSLERTDALYFEHHLNCAIRDGDWKLVCKGKRGLESNEFSWELYHMKTDRVELQNLADQHPEKVEELLAKWEQWAVRAKVKPWPYKKK